MEYVKGILTGIFVGAAMSLGHFALAAPEASWLDREPTDVKQMSTALEEAAVQLVKAPSLEEEVTRHLNETLPGINPNRSTIKKLEVLYIQLTDRRSNFPAGWAASAAEYFGKLKCGPVVMEALKHPSISVQLAGVRALGALKYRPAGEILVELLRRHNFDDRGFDAHAGRSVLHKEQIKALSAITGIELPLKDANNVPLVESFIAQCEKWLAEHPLPAKT